MRAHNRITLRDKKYSLTVNYDYLNLNDLKFLYSESYNDRFVRKASNSTLWCMVSYFRFRKCGVEQKIISSFYSRVLKKKLE